LKQREKQKLAEYKGGALSTLRRIANIIFTHLAPPICHFNKTAIACSIIESTASTLELMGSNNVVTIHDVGHPRHSCDVLFIQFDRVGREGGTRKENN
jgi:hypothetical protein